MRPLPSILALTLLLTGSTLQAQTPLACAMAGIWGERGITRDIAVHAGRAFVADGRGLSVYDVANPASIRRLGLIANSSETRRVAVDGQSVFTLSANGLDYFAIDAFGIPTRRFAKSIQATELDAEGGFLVTAGNELILWKISASGVEELDRTQLSAPVRAIDLEVERLFVATASDISIYDVSTGTLRRLSSEVGSALDLVYARGLLYLVDGTNGLYILDVTDPASPRFLGSVGRAIRDLRSVEIIGNVVYASNAGTSVDVYDVSGPAAPRLIATLTQPSAALASDGQRLYAAGPLVDKYGLTSASGRLLTVLTPGGATPPLSVAGSFAANDSPISGVASDGSYAYVSDPPYFHVIDIRNPLRPTEIASIVINDPDPADRVGLHGQLAYLYGRGNVHLIDISNPRTPREAGVFFALGVPPSGAGFAGDYLIEANNGSGLHVVDISDPSRPRQTAGLKYDALGQFYYAFGRPGVAYGVVPSGIRVADISNPNFALSVRVLDIPQVRSAIIAPADGLRNETLILERADQLSFYEMSDPLLPTQIASIPLPNGIDIAVDGSIASVITSQGELFRIDFNNPADPQITHRLTGLVAPSQVWAAAGLVLVADTYSLRVLRDLASVNSTGPCEFVTPKARVRATGRR